MSSSTLNSAGSGGSSAKMQAELHYDFWSELVEKRDTSKHDSFREFDTHAMTSLDEITTDVIDNDFDLTSRRVGQVYRRFDADNSGAVSSLEFQSGLSAQGITLSREGLIQLYRAMGVEDGQEPDITLEQFGHILQRLKLADLFSKRVIMLESEANDNNDNDSNCVVHHGEGVPPTEISMHVPAPLFAPEENAFKGGVMHSPTGSRNGRLPPLVEAGGDGEEAGEKDEASGSSVTAGQGEHTTKHAARTQNKQTEGKGGDLGSRGKQGLKRLKSKTKQLTSWRGKLSAIHCVEASHRTTKLTVTDYSSEQCSMHVNLQGPALKEWFFTNRPSWVAKETGVRWVHMHGLDKIMLLRLAVKYKLHPLAVEDCFEMEAQPSKVDRYGDHLYFCALNVVQLDDRNKSALNHPDSGVETGSNPDLETTLSSSVGADEVIPLEVKIHLSFVSVFAAGPPYYDTVLTVQQNAADVVDEKAAASMNRQQSFHRKHSQSVGSNLFDAIQRDLGKTSRLRDYKSDFLWFKILDKIADELAPISFAYDSRLNYLHKGMLRLKTKFPKAGLEEISRIKLEINDLLRTIRPLNKICHHMIEDKDIGEDTNQYLEDVEDHIDQASDEMKRLVDLCTTLAADYRMYGEQRQNSVLYVLTVVTTVFIPAQFCTGLYGMNFVNRNGDPGIPELSFEYGYTYFWVLVASLTSIVFLLFKCMDLL